MYQNKHGFVYGQNGADEYRPFEPKDPNSTILEFANPRSLALTIVHPIDIQTKHITNNDFKKMVHFFIYLSPTIQ